MREKDEMIRSTAMRLACLTLERDENGVWYKGDVHFYVDKNKKK